MRMVAEISLSLIVIGITTNSILSMMQIPPSTDWFVGWEVVEGGA